MERINTEEQSAENSGGKGGSLVIPEESVDSESESEAGASFTDVGNIFNEEAQVYKGQDIDTPQDAVFQPQKAAREK